MPCVSVGNEGKVFVHLAYLDESGTDGHSPIVMFGAVIVPHGKFFGLEALHSTAIQQILPVERVDEFTEFHACELYQGTGLFDGVSEEKRFTAIQVLLQAVDLEELVYVYSAVDRKKFRDSPFGVGKPIHTTLHMCLLGVEDWARANHPNPSGKGVLVNSKDYCLYVLDDCDDKNLKEEFRRI